MIPKSRLVVIGNGMAGARLVENVLNRGGHDRFTITVFGAEPYGNYNRILLSGILAGSHRPADIFINPLSWYADNGVRLHRGVRVDSIDLAGRFASSACGVGEPYDALVIATGSSGAIPAIDGLRSDTGALKDGVFIFRTLDDCRGILQRAETSRRAIVVGGGLLGLEAAKGLLNRGLEVHVLHLMAHVMETQLDRQAGSILAREIEQMGIHLHLNTTLTAVIGESHVAGAILRDGSVLHADMLVVAAGIRPNVDLARRAGLEVERGIVVGDDLSRRPASGVYAIGECAQHRGRPYGLVAPVWEQAQLL